MGSGMRVAGCEERACVYQRQPVLWAGCLDEISICRMLHFGFALCGHVKHVIACNKMCVLWNHHLIAHVPRYV